MSTTDNIVSLMNETRSVADYRTTWRALDEVDAWLGNLASTVAIFDAIDLSDRESAGRIATMQRHLLTDLKALQASNATARAAILNPKKATKGDGR